MTTTVPASRTGFLEQLNGRYHRVAMSAFLIIVLAHWAEHLTQAYQIWVLGWPVPKSRGVLGLAYPWLVTSEWLHYGYAIVMLLGLFLLRRGFTGRAKAWWTVALVVQFWHHLEHLLLFVQAQSGTTFFGKPVATSLLQLVLPRVELHLFYNTIVFVPMVLAMVYHLRPSPAEAARDDLHLRPAAGAGGGPVTTASAGAHPRRAGARWGGWAVALAAVAVLASALSGGGPVRVATTIPADGATLDRPPAEVAVDLTEVADAREYHLTVVPDTGGPPVTTGAAELAQVRLRVPVAVGQAGGYQAAYHLWLADGRQLSGTFRFTVAGSGPSRALPGVAPAGHAHGADDPVSVGLVIVDLVLVVAVLGILARLLGRRRAGPGR